MILLAFQAAVDLVGRLGDQENAAADQDEVAPGESLAEDRNDRLHQPSDPGKRCQQHQPGDQRHREAKPPRCRA